MAVVVRRIDEYRRAVAPAAPLQLMHRRLAFVMLSLSKHRPRSWRMRMAQSWPMLRQAQHDSAGRRYARAATMPEQAISTHRVDSEADELTARRHDGGDPCVAAALAAIDRTHGNVAIAALADGSGMRRSARLRSLPETPTSRTSRRSFANIPA
jgi:hypothetical protein